jgi:hypothetical protein
MKIVIDVDKLLQEGRITSEEYTRLKSLAIMWLTTESGDIPCVTAEDINSIRPKGELGSFAQLFASKWNFIQAAPEVPGPRRKAFLLEHGSNPWVLQYGHGDEQPGQVFQAAGLVTWDQVRQAFLSFLAGGEHWRQQFTWAELSQAQQSEKPWWKFW